MNDEDNNDFEFVRDKFKSMLETGEEVISSMTQLAKDTEHPRAYEVLSTMMRQQMDLAEKIVELQKTRSVIRKNEASIENPQLEDNSASTTNNNVFVGSTADFQKMMRTAVEEKDVTPKDE